MRKRKAPQHFLVVRCHQQDVNHRWCFLMFCAPCPPTRPQRYKRLGTASLVLREQCCLIQNCIDATIMTRRRGIPFDAVLNCLWSHTLPIYRTNCVWSHTLPICRTNCLCSHTLPIYRTNCLCSHTLPICRTNCLCSHTLPIYRTNCLCTQLPSYPAA